MDILCSENEQLFYIPFSFYGIYDDFYHRYCEIGLRKDHPVGHY